MKTKVVTYGVLTLGALAFLFPFYYMVVVASRTMAEVNQVPPPLTPGGNLLHNIQAALQQQAIGKAASVAWVAFVLIVVLVLVNTTLARWRTRSER